MYFEKKSRDEARLVGLEMEVELDNTDWRDEGISFVVVQLFTSY